jgi:hypothetical protein
LTLPIDQLARRTAAALRARADSVAEVAGPITTKWTLSCSDLTRDRAAHLSDEISAALGAGCPAVYAINLVSSDGYNEVKSSFTKAKTALADYKFAQVNKAADCEGSNCLYVGKSLKTGSRLGEHLGLGHRSTFAIRLVEWAHELSGKIEFEVMIFPDATDQVLTCLEDQLAVERRPILGRRGSKN